MTQIEIEEVLRQAKVGLWNIKMFLISCFVCVMASEMYHFKIFAFGEMDYTCDVANSTEVDNDNCNFKSTNNSDWEKCRHFKYKTDEFYTSMVSEFNLVCDRKEFIDYNISIMMISQLLSTFACNFLMDKFGRRKMLVISLILNIICSSIYLIAPSIGYVLLTRAIDCFFLMSSFVAAFVLISESLPTHRRAFGTNSAENGYGIGIALSALISYLNPTWKSYITTAYLVPALISLFLTLTFIDESPKWLLQKNKYEEVSILIRKIFKSNRVKIPCSIECRIEEMQQWQPGEFTKDPTIVDQLVSVPFWHLFRRKKTAFRMIILAFIWITCVAVYYGLLFGPELFKISIHFFFMINGLSVLPGNALQLILATNFGRKPALMTNLILTGAFLILGVVLPRDGYWILAIYFVACGSFLTITASFATVYMWHGELMPTNMRAIGIGLGSLTGRFCGIFIPLVKKVLEQYSKQLPVYFLAGLTFACAILALAIPETLNQLMPDNIEEYECFGTIEYTKIKNKRQALIQSATEA